MCVSCWNSSHFTSFHLRTPMVMKETCHSQRTHICRLNQSVQKFQRWSRKHRSSASCDHLNLPWTLWQPLRLGLSPVNSKAELVYTQEIKVWWVKVMLGHSRSRFVHNHDVLESHPKCFFAILLRYDVSRGYAKWVPGTLLGHDLEGRSIPTWTYSFGSSRCWQAFGTPES